MTIVGYAGFKASSASFSREWASSSPTSLASSFAREIRDGAMKRGSALYTGG